MTTGRLRQHWFFIAAPIVLAASVLVGHSARGQVDRVVEWGLLFDLVVLIPALYWLCYRHRGKPVLIKVAALACLGIWVALKLVPAPERQLLNHLEPLRHAGLVALVWLELIMMVAIYRALFKGASAEQVAHDNKELPLWVARLLAWEARLWQKMWHAAKRVFRRP